VTQSYQTLMKIFLRKRILIRPPETTFLFLRVASGSIARPRALSSQWNWMGIVRLKAEVSSDYWYSILHGCEPPPYHRHRFLSEIISHSVWSIFPLRPEFSRCVRNVSPARRRTMLPNSQQPYRREVHLKRLTSFASSERLSFS